ncbi:unnamed protein product [Auanema sp. JU1783]|nr:unnamed protein product [Auanema sp. JU1783]
MSAAFAKLLPDVNSVDNIITVMTGIQSNENKDDVVLKIADLARRSKDILEKKAPELEPFLIRCENMEFGAPMVVAGIRAMYDSAVVKNNEQSTDRAIEVLKHYMDDGTLKSEHLKYCLDIFVPLVRNAVYYCSEKKKQPAIGFQIADKAMSLVFNEDNSIVSSLHSAFLFLCVEVNNAKAALPYIYSHVSGLVNENPQVSEFPLDLLRSTKVTVTQFFDSKYLLQYLYYASLVLLNVGQYRRAIIFLEHCITLPISNPNGLQLNAFKKYYIVSLILHGRLDIPSSRSSALLRAWKADRSAPYSQLVQAAGNPENSIEEVTKTLKSNATAFNEDENAELVQALIETIKYKAVLKVAKSFSSITLTNLAARAKLVDESDVIPIINKLVNSGELNASISPDSNVIHLDLPIENINRKDIDERIRKLEYMCGEVKKMDLAARLNPMLITRNLKNSSLSYFQDDEGLSMSNNPIDM